MNAPIFLPTQPAAHLISQEPVDVDAVLEQEQAEQTRPWVTTTLRSIAKWALICAALSLLAGVLTGCGGGDDADEIQGPPDTRLIDPPRDSRVL